MGVLADKLVHKGLAKKRVRLRVKGRSYNKLNRKGRSNLFSKVNSRRLVGMIFFVVLRV
jgi:hypothetical protein